MSPPALSRKRALKRETWWPPTANAALPSDFLRAPRPLGSTEGAPKECTLHRRACDGVAPTPHLEDVNLRSGQLQPDVPQGTQKLRTQPGVTHGAPLEHQVTLRFHCPPRERKEKKKVEGQGRPQTPERSCQVFTGLASNYTEHKSIIAKENERWKKQLSGHVMYYRDPLSWLRGKSLSRCI